MTHRHQNEKTMRPFTIVCEDEIQKSPPFLIGCQNLTGDGLKQSGVVVLSIQGCGDPLW
jgi:hypothetical protein